MKISTVIGMSVLCFNHLFFPLQAEDNNKFTSDQMSLQDDSYVTFTPPADWLQAEQKTLPPHVKAMIMGKGSSEFPPSINLATEEFKGTVKDYLQIVKNINQTQGSEWKDLGSIRTEAGEASLSQADVITEWGPVQMMHVILSHEGTIYILTAVALKNEFPKFYKTFFDSLRSIRIEQGSVKIAKMGYKVESYGNYAA